MGERLGVYNVPLLQNINPVTKTSGEHCHGSASDMEDFQLCMACLRLAPVVGWRSCSP